jgi:hypothetical protein
MDKLKDFFLALLTWIGGSFFRLLIVIILLIVTMFGWVIYTEKDSFMASYRAQQALPKMNGNYEMATEFIFKNSEAELIAIFDVNMLLNTRKIVYLVTRNGRIKTHDGLDVGLLTGNHANNTDVIALMQGQTVCSSYTKPQSYIGFTYKNNGITYMCRISVPPTPDLFIGQVSVGWKEKPADEEVEKTVLTAGASMLYTKKGF